MPAAKPKRKDKPIVIFTVLLVLIVLAIIETSQSKQQPGEPAAQANVTATHTRQPAHKRTLTPAAPVSTSLPDWLTVYFTDPSQPAPYGQGIDQQVLPLINAAQQSIDVTSFDLNIPSLIDALAGAAKRGVKVRVVYDGENGSLDLENTVTNNKLYDAIKVLKAAKVGLVNGGRSNGLMHDKMLILDGKTLIMGSWNLSYNDSYRNNNNLLKINDPQLIANYQAKFNELYVDKLFGTHAQVKVPNPQVTLAGVPVENYFSPEDQVMAKLVQAVNGAQQSVHFMIFTYTDQDLANAMIRKAKEGLDVQGVIEARGASNGVLPDLYCAKLPVKTDGNKYTMHHKVMIIDGQTVVTGSFNFTNAADEVNDDNVLILHSPAIAALYEQEYQRLFNAGSVPNAEDMICDPAKRQLIPQLPLEPGEGNAGNQR